MPGIVDQYFNDSTGTGNRGEVDVRGQGTRAGVGSTLKRRRSKDCSPSKLVPGIQKAKTLHLPLERQAQQRKLATPQIG
jgi:hypothetical protein